MKHKKLFLVGTILIALASGLLIASFLQHSGIAPNMAILKVYGAGTPDSYGNQIYSFEVDNTTGYPYTVASLSYTDYVSGYTLAVPADTPYYLTIRVYITSAIGGSIVDAMSKAQVLITINGVVTQGNATIIDANPLWSGYKLRFIWPDPDSGIYWTPIAGTTYPVTIEYSVYY